MKKVGKIPIFLLSIVISLVVTSSLVEASPLTRATPTIKEATLAPYETTSISAPLIQTATHHTHYIYLVTPLTYGEKETIGVREVQKFGNKTSINRDDILYTAVADAQGVCAPFNTPLTVGSLTVEITNYSTGPVTYKLGLNTGLYEKTGPQDTIDLIETLLPYF